MALPEGVMTIMPSRVMPMVKSPLGGWGDEDLHGAGIFSAAAGGVAGSQLLRSWWWITRVWETLDYPAEPLPSRAYGGPSGAVECGAIKAAVFGDGEEVREFGTVEQWLEIEGRAVVWVVVPDAEGPGWGRWRIGWGPRQSSSVLRRDDWAGGDEALGCGEVGNWMEADQVDRGCPNRRRRFSGVGDNNIHFLDMPFYETGRVRKNPIGEGDVNVIADLLLKVKPHQIYAAGDLSDPHGTHRVCLSAIFAAMERLKNEQWMPACDLWLYRGAWQEWGIDEVEMAVPLFSLTNCSRAHGDLLPSKSQKDKALFPGTDQREFWQRSEDRNRATAKAYDGLGLAE